MYTYIYIQIHEDIAINRHMSDTHHHTETQGICVCVYIDESIKYMLTYIQLHACKTYMYTYIYMYMYVCMNACISVCACLSFISICPSIIHRCVNLCVCTTPHETKKHAHTYIYIYISLCRCAYVHIHMHEEAPHDHDAKDLITIRSLAQWPVQRSHLLIF